VPGGGRILRMIDHGRPDGAAIAESDNVAVPRCRRPVELRDRVVRIRVRNSTGGIGVLGRPVLAGLQVEARE
jgi:hypothetical protein